MQLTVGLNILESGQEREEREESEGAAPGNATTYYVLGRMPYIMHAAVTVISGLPSVPSL